MEGKCSFFFVFFLFLPSHSLHTPEQAILVTIVCKRMFFYHILILHTNTKIQKKCRKKRIEKKDDDNNWPKKCEWGKLEKKAKEYENKLIWLVQDIIKTCTLLSFRLAFLLCKHILTILNVLITIPFFLLRIFLSFHSIFYFINSKIR